MLDNATTAAGFFSSRRRQSQRSARFKGPFSLSISALRRDPASRRGYAIGSAPEPAGGLAPRARPSLNVRTAVGVVPNPLRPRERQQATINTATDVLETEFAARRISPHAYSVGCLLRELYEAGSGVSGASSIEPGTGGNKAKAREHQMVMSLDRAATVVGFEKRLDRLVGELGRRFLRRIFSGESYAQVAGCNSDRRIAFVAGRFRAYLEELSDAGFM